MKTTQILSFILLGINDKVEMRGIINKKNSRRQYIIPLRQAQASASNAPSDKV